MRRDSKRWGGVLKATGDHIPLFIASRNQDRELAPETRDRLRSFSFDSTWHPLKHVRSAKQVEASSAPSPPVKR